MKHTNQAYSLFICLNANRCSIAKFLFLYKDDLHESFNQITAQWCNMSPSNWRLSVKSSHTCKSCSFFSFFFLARKSCSFIFFWHKIAHFSLVFTTSSENSRTSLILMKIQFWPPHTSQWLTWQTPVLNVTQLQHWELDCLFAAAGHFPDFLNKQRFLIYKLLTGSEM